MFPSSRIDGPPGLTGIVAAAQPVVPVHSMEGVQFAVIPAIGQEKTGLFIDDAVVSFPYLG